MGVVSGDTIDNRMLERLARALAVILEIELQSQTLNIYWLRAALIRMSVQKFFSFRDRKT